MLFNDSLKKNIFSGVLFFMVFFSAQAKAVFRMNEKCLAAQSSIYQLKIEEAKIILEEEALQNPENIAVPWLQEYCLFLGLFISENRKDYALAQAEWNNLIERAGKLNTGDPWQKYILSDMYLHRAAVKLKMDENLSAAGDIKHANRILKENESRYPAFLPDNKNLGLINALFSAIPNNYKWLGKILGFEGNLEAGMSDISLYLNSTQTDREHQYLKLETAFIYALLQHHFLKNSLGAWNTIKPYTEDYKHNLLMNYMRATIAGSCGLNDEMISILSSRPVSRSTVPFYYMDYMLGVAKLRRLDKDADQYLKIYTVKFKGGNYIKSAYRYLAWYCIVNGDDNKASTYYSLCRKNGSALQEEDVQAAKEANETAHWDGKILKCRLLFDGHYYTNALSMLNGLDNRNYTSKRSELEINYRKARIYMETGAYASALVYFDKVISEGKKESYYFAAYSALYMAMIYEELKNKEQAIHYYNMAKDDFPANREYRSSIEQKARLGLKRLRK